MQLPGESIGIIADDLTGACDTALQFHKEGSNTRILLDTEWLAQKGAPSSQTWIINSDSRHMEPAEAKLAVRNSLHFLRQSIKLERFYKKIDSTLRGHVAHECLTVLEELGWKAAIVAPAYPEEGRRTVGGYQLVRGIPVEQSEIARDPMCPVSQSHLPTLLAASSSAEEVGYVPLSTVLDGAGPILKALLDQIIQHKKLIVVDACTEVDLEQLALAINKLPSDVPVLPCGSAGLAKALTRKWVMHHQQPEPVHMSIADSPVFMVIGSASTTARHQMQLLIDRYDHFAPNSNGLFHLNLSPEELLGLASLEGPTQQILNALQEDKDVLLCSALTEDSLTQTLALAEQNGISPHEASLNVAESLATITKTVEATLAVKLVVSGGETATYVARAMGSKSFQIIDALHHSIPLMIDDQARWVVSKSGSFGDTMVLLKLINALKTLELSDVMPA